MSPDGHFLATGTAEPFMGFLGGGGMMGGPGPVGMLGGPGPVGPGLGFPMPAGSLENPIQIWNTHSGKLEGTYLKDSRAWQQEFSPRFRYIAARDFEPDPAQRQTNLHLADLQAKTEKRIPFKGSFDYRFSPQETFVLVSEESGKTNKAFHLVKTATGKVAMTFQGSVFHGFVPDESLIVFEARHGDSTDLCIWNVPLQKVVHTLPKVSGGVTLSPDGRTVAAIMADALLFPDLRTFQTRRFRSRIGVGPESKMIFSPDGGTLALFLESNVAVWKGIEIWDVAAGQQKHGDFDRLKNWRWDPANFNSWGSTFCFVAFSPDSALFALAAATPDGARVGVWDLSSAALLWMEEPIDAYLGLAFTADSQFLIADPERNTAEIRYARTGQKHRVYSASYSPLAKPQPGDATCEFTRDLRFITIRSDRTREPHFLEKLLGDWWPKGSPTVKQMKVAEAITGRELARLQSASLEEAFLSEDGQTLVTKHQENAKAVMRVWDLPLRPPLRLVIGIPLGLGLLVLLFSRWRARINVKKQ
jgi:WD40 repeat protein